MSNADAVIEALRQLAHDWWPLGIPALIGLVYVAVSALGDYLESR